MKQYCAILLIIVCSISDLHTCNEKNRHKKRKHHVHKKVKDTEIENLQDDIKGLNLEKDFDIDNKSDSDSLFMELKKTKAETPKETIEAKKTINKEAKENNEAPSLFMELKKNSIENKNESENENENENESESEKPKPAKKGKKGKKRKVIAAPNPDMIVQPKEKLDVILDDYCMIASPQFKNAKKFPPLELPNGEVIEIKIDQDYYRINDFAKTGPPSNKHFWFRMSGRNLYYSSNKDDLNVLGSIQIKSISDVEPKKPYADDRFCLRILDVHDEKWTFCPPNMLRKKKWRCAIRKILNIFDEDCRNVDLADSEITVLTKKVTQPIILVSQANRMCNDEWDYSRQGSDWECTCQEGKEQSPIDLPKKGEAIESPAKPIFQYDEVLKKRSVTTSEGLNKTQRLRITYEDTVLKIKDTEFGKIVTLDGSVFLATEIIFHTPSEHKIGGKTYPMEMQVIHYGQTQGDIAKQVILSFLFESSPGAYNKFIDDVDFFNLPNPSLKARGIDNNLYIPKVFYNSKDEDIPIMRDFSFYTYQGSMTTPPCTERTIHYVASDPIKLGSTALTLFKEATRMPDMMDSAGNVIVNTNPSGNARKTQALNGRRVFHYTPKDACPIIGARDRKVKKDGHYEKIVKKATEYFYVNNEYPSRLPGALVVSEDEAKGYV